MECLRSTRQFCQRPLFQSLREAVEQGPGVAMREFLMLWLTPFTEDGGDEPVRHHGHVTSTDDEIVGCFVLDLVVLVRCDPFILVVPLGQKQADGPFHELWQVPVDVWGMLASKLHLSAERQIVTDEHGGTGDDPSRK